MKNIIFFSLSLLLSAVFFSGCASEVVFDRATAKGAYSYAADLEKDERYEEALVQLRIVKNKFPYSKYSSMAELKIADIHFTRESFAEALSAYRLFKDFHPKHSKVDYVTYRIAISIFNLIPTSIDRDITKTKRVILYLDDLIINYPRSKYFKKAQEKKLVCLKMQANKIMYIADYYFKQKIYNSALGRYEDLLASHPRLGFDSRALYGAFSSARKTNKIRLSQNYYKKLLSHFPKSKEAKKAKVEVK